MSFGSTNFGTYMDIKCTKQELIILKKVARAAEELGVEAWLVGGFVRDKILNRSTTARKFE